MADPEVLKIFDSLKKLHEAKDADYAGGEPLSNFKRCEQFGIPAWKGCLIRLSDKYARMVSLVGNDGRHEVPGEGLDDTLRDLAVYSVITLALLSENQLECDISVSGDRVKSSVDEPVIKTQAECAKRLAEADEKRRNYARINN